MEPSVIDSASRDRKLDQPPPQPPRNRKSLMNMAAGPDDNSGTDTSSPVIQAMAAMGAARQALLKLSAALPPLAQGIQQIVQGLEQVVPQMVADIASGNPPGSSGAGLGSAGANQGPTAPPVQAGAP